MDRISAATRSRNMSHIRAKDTLPELNVRRYLHATGLRYRLHATQLPGKPDLVFAQRRICLFINGCFWHGCPKCNDGRRIPKSNQPYWEQKIASNKRRDKQHRRELQRLGWKVLVIWECETTSLARLVKLHNDITAQI